MVKKRQDFLVLFGVFPIFGRSLGATFVHSKDPLEMIAITWGRYLQKIF